VMWSTGRWAPCCMHERTGAYASSLLRYLKRCVKPRDDKGSLETTGGRGGAREELRRGKAIEQQRVKSQAINATLRVKATEGSSDDSPRGKGRGPGEEKARRRSGRLRTNTGTSSTPPERLYRKEGHKCGTKFTEGGGGSDKLDYKRMNKQPTGHHQHRMMCQSLKKAKEG